METLGRKSTAENRTRSHSHALRDSHRSLNAPHINVNAKCHARVYKLEMIIKTSSSHIHAREKGEGWNPRQKDGGRMNPKVVRVGYLRYPMRKR